MRGRYLRGSALAAAMASLALVISACGTRSSATSASGGKGPITIGMTIAETGSSQVDGVASLNGTRYAIAAINASGGWLGRQLKLSVINDQSEATASSQGYTKLINQEHVDLIVGPYGSDLSNAAAAVAARNRYVMVDPAMPSPMKQGRYAIAAEPTLSTYLAEFPPLAAQKGYSKLAIVGQNTQFGTGCMAGEEAAAKKAGVDVVYTSTYAYPTSDLSSIAQAIKTNGATAVGGCTFYDDGVALVRALNNISYKPGLLAATIAPSQSVFATTLGPLANGVISSTSWWPTLPTQGNKQFVAGYEKMFGQAPDYHAANYYAGFQALGDAVKAAGSLDQSKILSELYGKSYPTILGTFRVDPSTGTVPSFVQYLYQDGTGTTQKLVWPQNVAEAPVSAPYGG